MWDGKVLQLWVTQPPVRGAANQAVINIVAGWLDVPRSSVRIVSGHTGRTKLVDVQDVASLPQSDV